MNLDCGQCRVRDWSGADKASLVRHANNRNVWRNLSHRFPHPYTEADADVWMSMLDKNPYPNHWAIEVAGEAVGGIGIDPGVGIFEKNALFGYWLGEACWGRGIMTAAVRTTADYVFAELGLHRLESPVFEWNPASMRVLEKCGFQREGILRKSISKDGQVIDAVLYAKVKP